MQPDTTTNPSQRRLNEAAARLRAGGLVAFPTETVYGLGADALSERAVARVYDLKGRPRRNPLIVHVLDEAMARALAAPWPEQAHALASAFWPGPLTIVVARAAHVPPIVAAGGPTVALRCPDHPAAQALLRAFGGPVVGPSANRSGHVSPTTAAHVRESFGEEDVLVLDGGPCRVGIESTVVSVAGDRAVVLRRGAIGPEEIESVLRAPVESAAADDGAGSLASPGRLPSHYAPRAPMALFAPGLPPESISEAEGLVAVLARGAHSPPAARGPRIAMAMPERAEEFAARLYAALRDADRRDPALILVERPEDEGPLWDAIRDRLDRAAAPRG